MKPLLKWAGGKTKIAPMFEVYYDRKRRYVSLFAGGMGDVMAIDPTRPAPWLTIAGCRLSTSTNKSKMGRI